MRKRNLAAVLLFSLLLCGFSARAVRGDNPLVDWAEVKDLKKGSLLKTESGWGVIEEVEYFSDPGIFYNLSVSGPNSDFFANGVLAHNKNGGCNPTSCPVPGNAICANSQGMIKKEYCGCYGSGCRNDASIDPNCNNGGDTLCIEGDRDDCCSRGGDGTLGQCLRFDPGKWITISTIYSKSEADCCDDLDVYAWKQSGWSHVGSNLNGNGINCIAINDSVRYIDFCTDHGDCDHAFDWIKYTTPLYTVSGYVWDDTNEQNCVFNGGTESKKRNQRVCLDGGVGCAITNDDGNYFLPNVPPRNYNIWVDREYEGFPEPKDEWGMYCPTPGTYGPFPVNGNTVVNLGLRNKPPSWIQATNGDVYSGNGVFSPVPSSDPPGYERFFISANPDTAGGVCMAKGGITTNNRTSERGGGSPGWSVGSYGGVLSWPAIIDQISASTPPFLEYRNGNLEINQGNMAQFQGKIVLVNGDITINGNLGGDAEQLNAILIARGKITVSDSSGDELFKILGALYAKEGIFNNRELENRRIPAVSATFDPALFLNAPESLKEPRIIWREVAP